MGEVGWDMQANLASFRRGRVIQIDGVAPHGPRAERKGLQASPRGRNAERA